MAWLATDSLGDGSANWTPPPVELSTLAFLQYTSGSTASPRGVMVRHANLMHNLNLAHRMWASDSESVVLSWLPFFHDMGLIGAILGSLFVGCPLFLMSPTSFMQRPLRWLQAITRYRATHSGGPNFAFEHCVRSVYSEERQALDLSSWRVALTARSHSRVPPWKGSMPPLLHVVSGSRPCPLLWACRGDPHGQWLSLRRRCSYRLVDREALGQHRLAPPLGKQTAGPSPWLARDASART